MNFPFRAGHIENLVLIGVGEREWVSSLITPYAAHIICVEPDPVLTAKIRAQKSEVAELVHFPCILSSAAGKQSYRATDVVYLSLLEITSAVQQVFPGIVAGDTIDVKTVAPAELVRRMPASCGSNILCVNSLGVTLRDISALLAPRDDILPFGDVYLRASHHPDIAPDQSVDALQAWMRSCGYTFVAEVYADPDFPVLHFCESGLTEKLMQTRQQLRALQQSYKVLATQSNQHKSVAAARSVRIVELSEELAEMTMALSAAQQGTVTKTSKNKVTVDKTG